MTPNEITKAHQLLVYRQSVIDLKPVETSPYFGCHPFLPGDHTGAIKWSDEKISTEVLNLTNKLFEEERARVLSNLLVELGALGVRIQLTDPQ